MEYCVQFSFYYFLFFYLSRLFRIIWKFLKFTCELLISQSTFLCGHNFKLNSHTIICHSWMCSGEKLSTLSAWAAFSTHYSSHPYPWRTFPLDYYEERVPPKRVVSHSERHFHFCKKNIQDKICKERSCSKKMPLHERDFFPWRTLRRGGETFGGIKEKGMVKKLVCGSSNKTFTSFSYTYSCISGEIWGCLWCGEMEINKNDSGCIRRWGTDWAKSFSFTLITTKGSFAVQTERSLRKL